MRAAEREGSLSSCLLLRGTLTFAFIFVRLETEEAKLAERFGDGYREYEARVGRF